MKRSSAKRDKNRERKRAQRGRKKPLKKAQRAQPAAWKERMRRAGRGPLRECRISAGWRGESLVQVSIARDGPRGIAVGLFLVDLGCLGVKTCLYHDDLTSDEYEHFVDVVAEEEPFEPCEASLAVKLVQAGVRHAAGLGFRPPASYEAARELFADIEPALCGEELSCGQEGRPLYVEDPDDDAPEILRRLEERLGPEGFHYVPWFAELPDEPEEETLPAEDDPDPDERLYGRLRRTGDRLVDAIVKYAAVHRGRGFLEQALAEYDPDQVGALAPGGETGDGAFLHWAFFDWAPQDRAGSARRRGGSQPAALEYLAASAARLEPFERRFLETACRRPFSFYEVESAQPGRSLALRDILSDRRYVVREQQASRAATVGGVLYARVLPLDSVTILVGCAPLCIPASFRLALIDLREELAGEGRWLQEEQLREHDHTLRETYWEIAEQIYRPRPPVLENTDGEPLCLCRVIFDLRCPPAAAASALLELALDWTDQDLREEGVFDQQGELRSIELPWHRIGNRVHASWDNTVLGWLGIKGSRLVAEVNSEARAQRIRSEVERLLGAGVRWRTTESDSSWEPLDEPGRRVGRAPQNQSAPAAADPLAREALARAMAAHWRSWIDTALPALRGETPREAARTAAGRERLEALLCGFAASRQPSDPLLAPDLERLRRELGLPAGG